MIVGGSQQGLDRAARVLLDPGSPAWIEDPGYFGVRRVVHQAGACAVPVPVDEEGLVVAAGVARSPRARAAFVTPSHQFPLGVTMSGARRPAADGPRPPEPDVEDLHSEYATETCPS
jgi:GntR family transcriptional regulator/MocR family aminotransferase